MENLYSISECHDISFCNLDELNTTESPKYAPCGKVVPNVRAYILDDQLEQVSATGQGLSECPTGTLSPHSTYFVPLERQSLYCYIRAREVSLCPNAAYPVAPFHMFCFARNEVASLLHASARSQPLSECRTPCSLIPHVFFCSKCNRFNTA